MTRLYIIIALTVVIAVVSQVKADCVHNIYGKVFCGDGQCLVDDFGSCSSLRLLGKNLGA